MSAQVVQLHVAPSAERRRAQALRDIAIALQAYELTVRCTMPTLGNADAARTLCDLRDKLEEQVGKIEGLMDQFRELAAADQDESTE